MDYGVHIKKQYGNPSRRSKHYTKQARFEGSNRQIRGAIIKLLNTHRALNQTQIEKRVGKGKGRIKKIIQALHKEGFIKKKKGKIFIA